MTPFKASRTLKDAATDARGDLTQIRDDIARAVDVFTVLALVASVVLILSVFREG